MVSGPAEERMRRLHNSGSPLRATLVIAIAAVLSGCGGGGSPIPSPAPNPLLTVTPSSINFASVTVASIATQSLTLSNAGTGAVTVSQVIASGAAFTVNGPALPMTLGPGQTTSFRITFAPTTGGSATGTLTVTSNATASPLTETLSGTGAHVVDLSWTASSSSGVTGYNVYRSNTSEGQFNVINTSPVVGTSFEDSNVTAGQTYYYKTTAIGPGGVESAYSNVTSATVPSP